MRRRAVLFATALLLSGPGLPSATSHEPDAPVPAGAKFTILDLQRQTVDLKFQTEAVAGAVQALQVKETPTEIRIEMAADVLFDFDKADVRPDGAKALAKAADLTRQHGKRGVLIEGHTDSKGTDAYNQRLSERRAEAVRRRLQEREGVKGIPMKTRGWGAKKPVTPNTKPDGSDNPEGRQKKRRVEIIIQKGS